MLLTLFFIVGLVLVFTHLPDPFVQEFFWVIIGSAIIVMSIFLRAGSSLVLIPKESDSNG